MQTGHCTPPYLETLVEKSSGTVIASLRGKREKKDDGMGHSESR